MWWFWPQTPQSATEKSLFFQCNFFLLLSRELPLSTLFPVTHSFPKFSLEVGKKCQSPNPRTPRCLQKNAKFGINCYYSCHWGLSPLRIRNQSALQTFTVCSEDTCDTPAMTFGELLATSRVQHTGANGHLTCEELLNPSWLLLIKQEVFAALGAGTTWETCSLVMRICYDR